MQMQASSMQFALNPCSNNEESTKILSFKINNQLEALIEHKKDNLNLEIEFSSATEGKIYHGTTSFDLKISKCNAVEVYRSRSDVHSSSTSLIDREQNLDFCGTANNRCNVLTSIGVAGEELRSKRKKVSDIRDLNASKSSEIIQKKTKKRCPTITTPSFSTVIPDASTLRSVPGAVALLPTAASSHTSLSLPPVNNKGASTVAHFRKRQEINATSSNAVSSQIKVDLPRRFKHFGKLDSHWLVMTDLPNTISKSIIKTFLSGLKVIEMYSYYHTEEVNDIYRKSEMNNNRDNTEKEQVTDVYVQFESPAGVEAAMLRNGELITIERKLVTDVTLSKELPLMDSFVTSLNRVSALEATWAKALCVRLESYPNNCLQNISRLRSIFPLSLLSISPSTAAEKWLPFVPLGSYLYPNEIFSFSDSQKKNNSITSVSKHDYSESRGLYRDIHQMGGDISYTGLLGFGSSPYLERPPSIDLNSASYSTSNKETNFRNCFVKDDSFEDGKSGLRNHNIHGMQELCNPLKEISHTLMELSSILSDTLLMSYSIDMYKINDSINYSENEIVLDLAHRMSHMYQNLHKTIKNKRYSYSKSL